MIVFDSEQLGEIAGKLERWYNIEINFETEELKQYRISGTMLRNKPVDQAIMAISLLAPIEYEHIPQANKKDIINIKKK
jgi:ferric-dicitrate binding protein FerR (iron transport regulator)